MLVGRFAFWPKCAIRRIACQQGLDNVWLTVMAPAATHAVRLREPGSHLERIFVRLNDRFMLTATATAAVAAALMLGGCGKKAIDPGKTTKTEERKDPNSNMSAARIRLTTVVQSKPKSGEARYQLGALLLAEGEPQDAVSELQRALELQAPEAQVLPKLAEAMVQSGQFKPLVDGYATAKLTDPQAQAQLLASVAYAMASLGDLPEAQRMVATALASDPKSPDALLMSARLESMRGDPTAGLVTLDGLLAANPKNDAAWALKGDLLLRKPGQRKLAMNAYEKALEARPDQVYAASALIALQLAENDLDGARARFAKLEKLAPNNLTTVNIEGHLAYASGDHVRAREVFQSLLRALPENVNLLLASGENELRLKSYIQAETQFARAVSLAPRSAVARRLLGQSQLLMGQAAKAKVTLTPLLDAPDVGADVLALAAEAALLDGDSKAADALYTRISSQKPTDPRMRTLIASAALGKSDNAAMFTELRDIAAQDAGTSADLAIISARLRRDQFDQALEALAGLERKRPKDPMVQHLRGQVLSKKKDMAGARQSFEAALKTDPAYFPAVAALSAMDMQQNDAAAAHKRLDALLKAQPKNPQAMLAVAELLASQHAPRADVLKPIEAAVKVAPADLGARIALIAHHFSSNNFDAALNAAQAATTAMPDSVELLELLGRCQMRVKQFSQALTSYGKVVTLLPKSAKGHVGLADVYLANNQPDQAQRSIERALELSPNLPEAQAQAVLVALRKNQPEAAIALARQVQKIRPTEAMGFLIEGDIELRRGRWDAAAVVLRKALDKSSPGAAPVKLYQALARSAKPADADLFAAQWLKSHPREVGLLFAMGDAAQIKGDNAGAEMRYGQVLEVVPEHMAALNNLAMLKIAQKQPGATALAERAVAGAPDEPALLDTLAQALASENNLSRAIETQKRAVAIAPEAGELRLNLARWLIQTGDKAQAKGELDRLAKLGKQFKQQEEVTRLNDSLSASMLRR